MSNTRRFTVVHSTKSPRQMERLQERNSTDRNGKSANRGPLDRAIAHVAQERSRAGKALQILTGKLLEAQEEERRRIGRELHDGLNQQLAMLAVELGLLVRQVPLKNKQFRESLLQLRQRAEDLSNDLRNMTHQFHPAMLEHLGLIPALQSHCAEVSRHEGVHVWLVTKIEQGPPREAAICLYRIVQEALRNVVKHSGAKEAWVKISQDNQKIQLLIIDKGVGFRPGAAENSGGLGLISMEERARLLHGQLAIDSAPNQGTRIEIRIPIAWKEEAK